ncbi:MAG: phytanoyl-CoA dioxygenase family protein [Planctomycetes bacterium]|nr:phytanoyl-CoA dioxygenase family protein [Planctomycetota bacterium]
MTFTLTDAEYELLPTPDEVRSYQQHGWYISRPLFSTEQLERVVAASERYYAGERDLPMPAGAPDWGWTPAKGDCLRKNDWASLQNRELWQLVRSPVLAAIAATLAGTDEIRLWHDQLLYKPVDRPERSNNVGWHTDRGYWKTCSSSAMLTAWIPFHDCDESMGTVSMIDGSHRWPDNTERGLDFFNPDLTSLEAKFDSGGRPVVKVPMVLKAGQVSFHSCLTIHGSGPNRSDRPRRSIAVHLQDEANRWRKHVFPSGQIAKHGNDTMTRVVDGHPDYRDPIVCPTLWRGRVPTPVAAGTA